MFKDMLSSLDFYKWISFSDIPVRYNFTHRDIFRESYLSLAAIPPNKLMAEYLGGNRCFKHLYLYKYFIIGWTNFFLAARLFKLNYAPDWVCEEIGYKKPMYTPKHN